ncbi:MAG: hypothetical protein WBY53_07485 [Acidobacteriaceae bacterium]
MPIPDLQLSPPHDHNRLTPKLVIAAVVMVVVGFAVYFLNPRKTAEIKIDKIALFAPHTVSKPVPGVGRIIGTPAESEDDVYVVATVAITDELRLPLMFDSASATMTDSTGETLDATVVSPTDLTRLEQSFPQITPLVNAPAAAPLHFQDSIPPGETRVGTVVLLFPQINEEAWRSKRGAALNIRFVHGTASIAVALP